MRSMQTRIIGAAIGVAIGLSAALVFAAKFQAIRAAVRLPASSDVAVSLVVPKRPWPIFLLMLTVRPPARLHLLLLLQILAFVKTALCVVCLMEHLRRKTAQAEGRIPPSRATFLNVLGGWAPPLVTPWCLLHCRVAENRRGVPGIPHTHARAAAAAVVCFAFPNFLLTLHVW